MPNPEPFHFDLAETRLEELCPDTQDAWRLYGKDFALKLVEWRGGTKIHISSRARLELRRRQSYARQLLRQGYAVDAVTRASGLEPVVVRRLAGEIGNADSPARAR